MKLNWKVLTLGANWQRFHLINIFILFIFNIPLYSQKTKVFVAGFNEYSTNSKYPDLQFAHSDIESFLSTLPSSFEVKDFHWKGKKEDFLLFLENGISDIEENDNLIFYFSGHGKLENLVLPDGTEVSIGEILQKFSKIKNYFIIIDACRTTTLEKSFQPMLDLRKLQGGNSRVVLYSVAKGESSREDKKLKHSIFSYHFIETLKENIQNPESKELDVEILIFMVKEKIKDYYLQNCEKNCRIALPESISAINGKFVIYEKKNSPIWKHYLIPGLWQWEKNQRWKSYSFLGILLTASIYNYTEYKKYELHKENFQTQKEYLFLNSIGSIDSLDYYLYFSASSTNKEIGKNISKISTATLFSLGLVYTWNVIDLYKGDFQFAVYSKREFLDKFQWEDRFIWKLEAKF